MLNRKALSLTLSTLILVGCGGTSDATTTSSTENEKVEINRSINTTQAHILEVINKARSEVRDCHDGRGLVGPVAPLSWNDELYAAAYEHSSDLAQSNTFSHEGSGTSSDITGMNHGGVPSLFNERIEANGYVDFYTVGENIAGGQESIEEALEAWLNSPAHCTNIMNEKYKEIGVAVVSDPDSDYQIYWTQNFGSKESL